MIITEIIVFIITLAWAVMLIDNIKIAIRTTDTKERVDYFILSILNVIMLILYGLVCIAIIY